MTKLEDDLIEIKIVLSEKMKNLNELEKEKKSLAVVFKMQKSTKERKYQLKIVSLFVSLAHKKFLLNKIRKQIALLSD